MRLLFTLFALACTLFAVGQSAPEVDSIPPSQEEVNPFADWPRYMYMGWDGAELPVAEVEYTARLYDFETLTFGEEMVVPAGARLHLPRAQSGLYLVQSVDVKAVITITRRHSSFESF